MTRAYLNPTCSSFVSLEILRVNGNNLEGTIRDAFNSFQDLSFADFSRNTFTGPLPASIFDVPTCSILYFYENAFTGSIPANYANGPLLRDLYLQDNLLSGTVPSVGAGQLSVFTELRIETNQITGTMPASLCALRGDNNETDLVTLIADCAGNPPQVECDCCTACFEGSG
jgi:Leucine-rich repeat (LRR) protein